MDYTTQSLYARCGIEYSYGLHYNLERGAFRRQGSDESVDTHRTPITGKIMGCGCGFGAIDIYSSELLTIKMEFDGYID
jgi:hypothetical protein